MNEDRFDRLYNLLPPIYRMRDTEQGYPLQALLRVIAEQVNIVEDDIGHSTRTGSSRRAKTGLYRTSPI